MAFVWYPGIWRSDKSPNEMFRIPEPVSSFEVSRPYSSKEFNVPLLRQKITYGLTSPFRTISLKGQFFLNKNGTTTTTRDDEDQFQLLEDFEEYMDMYDADPGEGFELFMYNDGVSTYRKFKDCLPVDFRYDLGDDARIGFSWTAVILARNPVMFTTAPGA